MSNPRPRISQKVKLCLTALLLSLLLPPSGCMNLYTRCPGTKPKIESCYQSTETMFVLSYVVCFPQVIGGWDGSLQPENIITIPCGIICYLDTACEAVLDTVFLPLDYFLARYRNKTFAAPSHCPPYSPLPYCDSAP